MPHAARRIAADRLRRASCSSLVSGLLARWLSLENVERDDIVTLLHGRGTRRRQRDARAAARLRSPAAARTCAPTPAG